MLLGARTAAWSGGGWVNPYITEGLIAMWDCKYGVSPTGWRDASGHGNDVVFHGRVETTGDKVTIYGSEGAYGIVDAFVASLPTTQEMAIRPISNTPGMYARYLGDSNGEVTRASTTPFGWFYGFDRDMSYPIGSATWGNKVTRTSALKSGSGKVAFAYENGVKLGDGLSTNFTRSTYNTTLCLMNNLNGNRGVTADIYCIRIYDRVLSDDEILYNYEKDHERFDI